MRPLISALQFIRLRPFDISTVEGRDSERYRLAALGIATNFVSRAAGLILLIVGVKVTVPYLGPERFGVWATFASMTAMLSFLDLGVGNAIVNRVAHARADDDPSRLRDVITGGTGVLCMFGLGSTVLLLGGALLCPWGDLFHLTDSANAAEATNAAIVFSLLFGANVVSSGLLKVLVGQQRSFESNLLAAASACLACLAIVMCSRFQASVPWLILSTLGLQTVVGLFTIPLLMRRGSLVFGQLRAATRRERGQLVQAGLLFLLLQVGTMVGWGSDSLLLAGLLGVSHVAVYAIVQRLFQFASMPIAMLNAPLWASYADACARNDRPFIARTLRTSMTLSLMLGLAFVLVAVALAPWAIPWWTDNAVRVPPLFLGLFAVWTLLEICGNAFAMYLNGCGIVRQQVWVVLAFCLLALPLKAVMTVHQGLGGLMLGTIIAYITAVVGLYATVFRRDVTRPLHV